MATNNSWNSSPPIGLSFGGTGDTTLSAGGVIIGSGTSPLATVNPGTAGGLLVGATAASPSFIIPTQSALTVTSNATTFRYALPSPLPVSSGGTGRTSVATDNILAGGTTSTGNLQIVSASSASPGDLLTSNGSSALPTFSTPTFPVGDMLLVQTINATGLTSCDFTSNIIAFNYMVLMNNVTPSTGTTTLNIKFSTNGGSSWASTGYQAGNNSSPFSGTFSLNNTNSTTTCPIGVNNGEQSTTFYSAVIYIYNFNSSSSTSYNGIFQSSIINGSQGSIGQAYGTFSSSANAVQFIFANGATFNSGTFSLYQLN